jgi:hypothetical protein
MNTPTEFAIDNLQVVSVPEPASWALAILGLASLLAWQAARHRRLARS